VSHLGHVSFIVRLLLFQPDVYRKRSLFFINYLFVKSIGEVQRVWNWALAFPSFTSLKGEGQWIWHEGFTSAEAEPSNHFIDKHPLQSRYFLMIYGSWQEDCDVRVSPGMRRRKRPRKSSFSSKPEHLCAGYWLWKTQLFSCAIWWSTRNHLLRAFVTVAPNVQISLVQSSDESDGTGLEGKIFSETWQRFI
jgi:hypothetical protein